jgi:hypothetical protein
MQENQLKKIIRGDLILNGKSFLLMILAIIGLFLLLGLANTVYGADLDVVRDFDNVTVYHAVKSDYGSQTVSGIENNARLVTTGPGSQKTIEVENGYYEYSFLSDENGVRLNSTDRVKFNYNRTLTANYDFYPTFNAEITVIDPQGNADRYATFPGMKPGDSLTQIFADPVDYDTVHYDFWYIQDQDTGKIFAPCDNYTISYSDCLAVNNSISAVFEYKYGYFPDYTVTYISTNPNGVFDNVTITVNRENWSAFYTLPEAPTIEGKVLDYIHIVEDDVYNYKVGDTYEAMYDMCLSEGNNLTRTFDYIYKQGLYANVTVNYIFNIDNELNNTIFHREYYPMLVIGDEAVGGYVDYHPEVAGYEFNYVTFQEVITNGVKGMLPGSNVRDEGGFWVYEVNETGDIDLNFIYNYVPKVDPTPEPTPTPTPASGNETVDNETNETDPVIPSPIVPVDNKVVNDTNSTNITNITAKDVLNDSNVVTMPVTGKNPLIAIAVLIVFILVFVVGYFVNNKRDGE